MYIINKDMLKNEARLKNVLKKLERKRLKLSYSSGCPSEYCRRDLYSKYKGCDKFKTCEKCWDNFLNDIVIVKKNNMEVYNAYS